MTVADFIKINLQSDAEKVIEGNSETLANISRTLVKYHSTPERFSECYRDPKGRFAVKVDDTDTSECRPRVFENLTQSALSIIPLSTCNPIHIPASGHRIIDDYAVISSVMFGQYHCSSIEKWKYISSKYYYKSPFGNLRCDKVELPNGKIIEEYNVCEYTDWVSCVAVTRQGKVLLVRQYRHAFGDISLETIAGTPEEGESPADAIVRELAEETGYTSPNEPILLGAFATNPARNNNRMWIYLLVDCEQTESVHFDDTEDIELVSASFEKIEQMICSGEIVHQTSVLGIERARRTLGI